MLGLLIRTLPILYLLDSIVVSIPACHAGDQGSIPCRGAFYPYAFLSSFHSRVRFIQPTREIASTSTISYNVISTIASSRNLENRKLHVMWAQWLPMYIAPSVTVACSCILLILLLLTGNLDCCTSVTLCLTSWNRYRCLSYKIHLYFLLR